MAERLLGDALWARADREEVVIATKGGLRRDGERLVRDASAAWLRAGVESSLRELRTQYVDLYQVHWPDQATTAAETGDALARLVAEGKIGHVGVPNYNPDQVEELGRFVVVEELRSFAADRAISLVELAVAFMLAHPAVDVAIVGAQRPDELDGTVGATDVKLSETDLDELDAIMVSAVPVHGPSPDGMPEAV
jgi:aryl-alcohol dehydrogenase-like predicted oxidoreductase